ncbi:MAG: hypothetical protein NUV63_03975 [Gallionella sp.]|nr:hypothetical protein [Gallionella sp.]
MAFATAGYLSGEAFRLILDDFKRYQLYILLGLVIAGILFWLITLIRRRQRALVHRK